MKNVQIALLVLLLSMHVGFSQQLRIAPLIERTVAGSQYGTQLFFQSKGNWKWGGFYQASVEIRQEGVQPANPFYGVSISAPFVRSEKIDFHFNARCGIANQLIVVTPGLETEVKMSRKISISTLMGIRMSYPSALLKFNVTL